MPGSSYCVQVRVRRSFYLGEGQAAEVPFPTHVNERDRQLARVLTEIMSIDR